jgi:hypothetical protein
MYYAVIDESKRLGVAVCNRKDMIELSEEGKIHKLLRLLRLREFI